MQYTMLETPFFKAGFVRAAALAIFLLKCYANSVNLDSEFDIFPRAALVERDVTSSPPCGYWFTADNTTTCDQLLSTFNLKASELIALNPRVGLYDKNATIGTTGCGGVLRYETYCVAPGQSYSFNRWNEELVTNTALRGLEYDID